MLGIALGVTALITVLSVMNGFETELRQRILGMTSHATISGYSAPLDNWRELSEISDRHARVVGSAPYIQKEGMLIAGQQVNGSLIRGILPDEEPKVSEVSQKIIAGELEGLAGGRCTTTPRPA